MIYKILGFVILPTLIAAFFTSVIPRKLKERQRFNEAATAFRDVFLPEVTFLKHNARLPECERTYTTLQEFLRAGYIFRHLKAFEVFRDHLSVKKRMAIDKAWKEYCNFEQYSNKTNDVELKKIALERIEKILKFAEHK